MTSLPESTRKAFQLLRFAFVLVPLISGFDKLSGALVEWERFVSPDLATRLPFSLNTALFAVGLLEVGLGLLVYLAPRLGGFMLAGWFGASVVNFVLLGEHWHIAFGDAGLTLGALALAMFSKNPELAPASLSFGHEPRSRPRARSPRSDTLVSDE